MILISHRGNYWGKEESTENNPKQIETMIAKGYSVEFDVHYHRGDLWLGHDRPEHKIYPKWLHDLQQNRIYVHCKNVEAMQYINYHFPKLHTFFHQNDDVALTSKGYIWMHPLYSIEEKESIFAKWKAYRTIIVLPENYMTPKEVRDTFKDHYAVVTDNIVQYKDLGII